MVSPLNTSTEQSCNPLATAVNNTSVISGPPAPPRQMSRPWRLESATASPNLLLQSSQSSGSQSEPVNQNSQVSDSPQMHGMTLKCSNDEITDEELRELNLQTAAQQYMMESDAQQKTTPILFQKNQSPLRQVSMNEHYILGWSKHPTEPDCSKAASSTPRWTHQESGYKSPI